MQGHSLIKISLLVLFNLLLAHELKAQSSYLPLGDPDYHFLKRMETKEGALSNELFLSNKGVPRKAIDRFLETLTNENYYSSKTFIDNYNLFETLAKNSEWADYLRTDAYASKVPIGPFFKEKAHLISLHKRNFFLAFDPVVGLKAQREELPDQEYRFSKVLGAQLRGVIGQQVGFSGEFTHNSLPGVRYQDEKRHSLESLPGFHLFQPNRQGAKVWDFQGNVDVALLKDYINLDLGYGKHFIGDGIRSLFLSDFAPSNLYVGLNTKVWRLNYQNLFMQLRPQQLSTEAKTIGHKYTAIHYLTVNIRPWLNVGLYEQVIFSRNKGYELGYLNPIILYRSIERSLGSPDKSAMGISAKAIVAQRFSFYSQFLLNEFVSSEFFKTNGFWANKWGLQAGFDYYDVFGLPNLDLQAEVNVVRPYTYTHRNYHNHLSIQNFSSYNQPLAHPLGAGFKELIGAIHYQPGLNWTLILRGMYYLQGVDTGQQNLGNNILLDNVTRPQNHGIQLINGPQKQVLMGQAYLSYQLRTNFLLFAEATYRQQQTPALSETLHRDFFLGLGLQLNLFRSPWQNWY